MLKPVAQGALRTSNAVLQRLRAEALQLSDSERAQLATELMNSLDGPTDADAADAWDKEIVRRLDAIDAGTARLVDRDELRRRMSARRSTG